MDTATAPATAAGPTAAHSLIDARLSKIEDVARDTKLYTFERVDGGKLPGYKPGAHIDLHLPNGLLRQFSLTVPAENPDSYTVGVKRDENSRGGSRYIIEQMKVGDQIKISAPRNNFPLVENAAHVVLFAGGIGITPIWCMAQQLAALRPVVEDPLRLPVASRHGVLERPEKARSEIRPSAFRRRGRRQSHGPCGGSRRGAG